MEGRRSVGVCTRPNRNGYDFCALPSGSGVVFCAMAMTPNEKNVEFDESTGKLVRLEHVVSPGVQTQFANHAVVQHTRDGDFYISFFEAVPPLIVGDPGEVDEQFKQIESISANCITRIVVSANQMPKLIGALIKNHQVYLNHIKPHVGDESAQVENKKHAS